MIKSWEINGGTLEFDEETHSYFYEGIFLPSITSLLAKAFPSKYENIPSYILERAAAKGQAVHEAIERYERFGEECALPELQGYKALKEQYGFRALKNEIPILIYIDGAPAVAGRLDLITTQDWLIGVEDIKRTSIVDTNSLFLQLNWYAIGYEQTYGTKINYLNCLHLRENVAERISIQLDADLATEKLKELLFTEETNND